MMYSSVLWVALTLLLSCRDSSAFVLAPPSSSSTTTRVPLSAASTTLEAATTKLVPPKSTADLLQHQGETQELYDDNVQKTYGRFPLTIQSGKGCTLTDADGKQYLDFVAGIATCALGHSCPELSQAVAQQMNQVHHVSNLYLIPAQAALANWLCENSVADKVFFCNSGAEANEAAIKCARRHASNRGVDKPVILSAEQSFHGRTLAALTATAQPKYHKGFGYDGKMVPGFEYVPYNDIAALEAAVKGLKAKGQGLAAIMLEALQGEGGIVPGNAEYFAKARQLCDETGAFLICDEVQVGMGRSGRLWGYENLEGIAPDIFTSAKALGGGVPIGAMMARGVAADVFGPGDHASTYGGNPLACAAGLAVAQYLCDNDVLSNVQARGEQLSAGLEKIAAKYPNLLGEVRGWGLIKGVEVVDANVPPGKIVQAAMDLGLLLVGAGSNVVRFVPPLIVTSAEVDKALDLFEKAVAQVAAAS